ncbi:hypothetical protein GNI_091150 [Gregarina niphandrodes]|uniref:Uncharacterized protein n=1 Tax=Gregarina niphandrodes TaxID=110365 RepID=A0A023B5G5_GRENI|nr:hypothetical protein GNI_091150 [Gregarina niphandrodes]EZG60082.1 hypothetical protein GNI_091150 [Gregarina niphandrodes]|eukprot:XP_011130866.1 hypothetical protein GNI_091150 [Gregarina niphandrodes]
MAIWSPSIRQDHVLRQHTMLQVGRKVCVSLPEFELWSPQLTENMFSDNSTFYDGKKDYEKRFEEGIAEVREG